MKVSYCDNCGCPIERYTYIINIVNNTKVENVVKDKDLDFITKQTELRKIEKESIQYDLCESCVKLIKRVLAMRTSRVRRLKKKFKETIQPLNKDYYAES